MTRGSDMEEGPDLSHLTPEERAIIESVMVRQKQEEEREQEIMRYVWFLLQINKKKPERLKNQFCFDARANNSVLLSNGW